MVFESTINVAPTPRTADERPRDSHPVTADYLADPVYHSYFRSERTEDSDYLVQHRSPPRGVPGWFITHKVFHTENPPRVEVYDPIRRVPDDAFDDIPSESGSDSPAAPSASTPAPPVVAAITVARESSEQSDSAAVESLLVHTPLPPPTQPPPRPKMSTNKHLLKSVEPRRYDGKSTSECSTFLTAVTVYNGIADVKAKDQQILVALSKLDGNASVWALPYMDQYALNQKFEWASWNDFKKAFTAAFGLAQDAEDAELKLDRLCSRNNYRRNVRSVRFYTQDFNQLHGRTSYSDAEKVTKYHGGLSDRIKRVLINRTWKKSEGLVALQTLASSIDEEWTREFGEQNQQKQKVVAATNDAGATLTGGHTVTIAATNQVCYLCQKPGHFARDHQADGTIVRTPNPKWQRQPAQRVAATNAVPVTPSPASSNEEVLKTLQTISATMASLNARLSDVEKARAKENF